MSTVPRGDKMPCIYDYLVSRGFYGGDEGVFESVDKTRRISVTRKLFLRMTIEAKAWESAVPIEELLNREELNNFMFEGKL